jgi:hypothetical protein
MQTTEYSSANEQSYATRARDLAEDEASSVIDRFVNYAKANPVETALATAGVAFVAGAIILGPRLWRRHEGDLHRVLEKASREAKRVRSDVPSLRQVSNWVKAQLPS